MGSTQLLKGTLEILVSTLHLVQVQVLRAYNCSKYGTRVGAPRFRAGRRFGGKKRPCISCNPRVRVLYLLYHSIACRNRWQPWTDADLSLSHRDFPSCGHSTPDYLLWLGGTRRPPTSSCVYQEATQSAERKGLAGSRGVSSRRLRILCP